MESLKDRSNASGDTDVLVNEDENKYLNQIKYILENGKQISDRTGVGTISVFGMHSIYSLRNGKQTYVQHFLRLLFYLKGYCFRDN